MMVTVEWNPRTQEVPPTLEFEEDIARKLKVDRRIVNVTRRPGINRIYDKVSVASPFVSEEEVEQITKLSCYQRLNPLDDRN